MISRKNAAIMGIYSFVLMGTVVFADSPPGSTGWGRAILREWVHTTMVRLLAQSGDNGIRTTWVWPTETQSDTLRQPQCFTNPICLQKRSDIDMQITGLRNTLNAANRWFSGFLRTPLSDTEKTALNNQLTIFALKNELHNLDIMVQNVLRTTPIRLTDIQNRAMEFYGAYWNTLSPYVDPSKMDSAKQALQKILTDRFRLKELIESKRTLSSANEALIRQKIESVDVSLQSDFLSRLLTRLQNTQSTLSASSMDSTRKARLLAQISDIQDIVLDRLDMMGTTNTGAADMITSMSIENITSTAATISLQIARTGTGYYVVLPSGSTIPSALQVQLGQDANNQAVTMKGSTLLNVGANQIPLTGLAPSTSYDIYFTAADSGGNLQNIWRSFVMTSQY